MVTEAVKAIDGEMSLEVLGLPFGVDRQGQIFDAGTDIGLAPGDEVPAYYYHGFAERAAKSVGRIGKAVYDRMDDAGHWFKVQLDAASDKAAAIYEDAKAGMARASSDSSSHFVRPFGIVGKPGRVTSWPIFAMSLMDATTAGAAVNPRAVAFAAAKAVIDQVEFEDPEATLGEATKAGAVFAARNRQRINALRALLDEMLAEIPDEAEVASASAPGETPEPGAIATKGEILMDSQNQNTDTQTPEAVDINAVVASQVDAVKADFAAKLAEMDAKLAEANRVKFASVNVNKGDSPEAVAAKAYNDAFDAYIRRGERISRDIAVKATLNETTAAEGGYLVPTGYSNDLVKSINQGSVLRQAGARVLPVAGTNSFKIPTLTHSGAAAVKAEEAAFDEAAPALGEVTFTPWKYTRLSKVSDELLADSRLDVFGQVLSPDAAYAFVQAENTIFATGNGSATAQGVTVGASVGVTAAATNAITADEVIDLYHSLAPQYRNNATWIMSDAVLKVIRKFRESGSTTGAYLWQPSIQAGEPSLLLGRPVYTLSTMPAATTGLKPIVFGDMSFYTIADFGGLEMKRLDELYAASGQVGFRWFKRVDGNVMLSAAIKSLIMA
jgi:HK97 family phage major capsid protein